MSGPQAGCRFNQDYQVGSQNSLTQRATPQSTAKRAACLAGSLALAACLLVQPVLARQQPDTAVGTIAAQELPKEAQRTLERIEAGGPFPYDKDGSRFGNYERVLPAQPRGYYREYTVKSGGRNRGAKRIVCGGDQRAANDCYYTEDHYNSFKRISK